MEIDGWGVSIIIVAVILMIWIVVGVIVNSISSSECSYQCKKEHALAFEIFPQDGKSIDNDICVCYGKNWVHTFVLGDADE